MQINSRPARRSLHPPPPGFTLIELLIVVAIAAILATVAMPAYQEQVRKSRRADAIKVLAEVQQAQERWRANNSTYTSNLADLGVPASTDSGYYTLALSDASGSGYTVTATAASSQATDAKCRTLSLVIGGGTIAYNSTGTATSKQCWNR